MEVWVFADFRIPDDRAGWRTRLVDLNATDVVLGCNSEKYQRYRLLQARETYLDAARELRAAGLRVHLMTWLRPTDEYVDGVVDKFVPLAHDCGASSVLLDVEGFWIKAKGHVAAAERLFGRLGPDRQMPVGVTSYASLTKAVMPLLAEADYGLPQAYSIWDDERPETKRKAYGPGALQRRAYAKWEPHCERVVMGLAAYKQDRPHATVAEAMATAVDATRELGVDAVAYWSLFWLKDEAGAFAKTLRGAPGKPVPPNVLQSTDVLRRGSKDEFWAASHIPSANVLGRQVTDLQTTLSKLGFEPGSADGYYGKQTEAAVRAFQDAARGPWRKSGRTTRRVDVTFADAVDGVVGPRTKAELRVWKDAGYRLAPPPTVPPETLVALDADDVEAKYRAKVMALALGEVGVRERPRNSNAGKRVEEFQKAVGLKRGDAWCHAFAFWCHDNGARSLGRRTTLPPAYGGSVRAFRDAKRAGVMTFLPEQVLSGEVQLQPTDVGILVRDASRRDAAREGIKASGHSFLVGAEFDGDDPTSVEGNTNAEGSAEGDGVYRRTRSLRDPKLVGFIRPGLAPRKR